MNTQVHEIDIEKWALCRRDEFFPKAKSYKVRLWDGADFDETRSISTDCPTGVEILNTFNLHPSEEFVLLLLDRDGLTEIEPAQEINLRKRGAERFFAFRSDRTYRFMLGTERYIWGAESITELALRTISRVPKGYELVRDNFETADTVIVAGDEICLSRTEV